MRYVRTNPDVARDNGLLPIQVAITDQLEKLNKYLKPYEVRHVTLPWSSFVFSNTEAWPQQFREGLDNYCRYYRNRKAPHTSDRKVYKFVPSFKDLDLPTNQKIDPSVVDMILTDGSNYELSLKDMLDRTPLVSETDLLRRYLSDPSFFLGTYGANLRGDKRPPQYLVWSEELSGFIPYLDFPVIQHYRPRVADCDGVKITLVGFCRPKTDRRAARHERKKKQKDLCFVPSHLDGFNLWMPTDFFVTANKRSLDVMTHEVFHIAQLMANQLLLARTEPEVAFIDDDYAEKRYGYGKKKFKRFDVPSYLEDPIEFYPNAYSFAQEALADTELKDLPFVYRVAAQKVSHLIGLRDSEFIRSFLRTTYKYGKQPLSPADDKIIVDISNFQPDIWGKVLYWNCVEGWNPDTGEIYDFNDYRFQKFAVDLLLRLGLTKEKEIREYYAAVVLSATNRENTERVDTLVRKYLNCLAVAELIVDYTESEDLPVILGVMAAREFSEMSDLDLISRPDAPVLQRLVQQRYNTLSGRPTNDTMNRRWENKIEKEEPYRRKAIQKVLNVLYPKIENLLELDESSDASAPTTT